MWKGKNKAYVSVSVFPHRFVADSGVLAVRCRLVGLVISAKDRLWLIGHTRSWFCSSGFWVLGFSGLGNRKQKHYTFNFIPKRYEKVVVVKNISPMWKGKNKACVSVSCFLIEPTRVLGFWVLGFWVLGSGFWGSGFLGVGLVVT
jgi:hypothetical protein